MLKQRRHVVSTPFLHRSSCEPIPKLRLCSGRARFESQLANSVPTLCRYICDGVTERSDIASQSLRDQWHQLILCPLSKLDGSNCHSLYVLVVDALDECDDNNNIRIILQLLAEARSLQRVQLRVFLTSRPDIPIRYGINQIPDAERQDFVLHYISPSIVDRDISGQDRVRRGGRTQLRSRGSARSRHSNRGDDVDNWPP